MKEKPVRNMMLPLIVTAPLLLSACASWSRHAGRLEGVRPLAQTGEQMLAQADPLAAGKRMLASGNYGSAITAFRTALRLDPASATASNGLAIAYDAIGRPDLARRYFEQSMGLDPDNARYRDNYRLFVMRTEEANTARLAQASAATWPIRQANTATAPAQGQKLLRVSLAEVQLQTEPDTAIDPRRFAAPAEVRLATGGNKPTLGGAAAQSPAVAAETPIRTASSVDLARAVSGARMRIALKVPIIDRTAPCDAPAEGKAQCKS